MNKNLILMSALFAGSMIVNSGFGANLERNSTKREHDTELETQNDQVKRPCLDYDDETFKSSLPEELNAFITSNKLANLQVDDLLRTAVDIKKGYNPFKNLQSQEKKLIFNKILSVITNRDFKFDNRDSLENLIIAYHNDSTAIELITPDRLSNININDLLETAVGIKAGDYPFEILQDQTKKLILNKIFTALADRDFKFESWRALELFISVYYDNTKTMDLITPDKLSSINTEDLLLIASDIKVGRKNFSNLQEQEKEPILNEILNIITDRNFKFDDDWSLESFICAYHDNVEAINLITSNRVSNIDTGALLSIAEDIKK